MKHPRRNWNAKEVDAHLVEAHVEASQKELKYRYIQINPPNANPDEASQKELKLRWPKTPWGEGKPRKHPRRNWNNINVDS